MPKRLIFLLLLVILFQSARAQKGYKSISAGPLISFPVESPERGMYKTGIGLEITGQYYLARRSSLLLQIGLTSLGAKYEENLTIISLKGGYKYDIGSSGFFVNGLVGTDIYNGWAPSFALGGGKRFSVKDIYFIDAGIDLIGGDTQARVNIKAAFSILQRPKKAY